MKYGEFSKSTSVFAGVKCRLQQQHFSLHSHQNYCGLKIGRMSVRKLCYAEAPKMAEFMQHAPEVATDFFQAEGNVEITMDATKVNTMGGLA